MTTTIMTRQLYNRADLDSLVTGDRVKLDAGSEDRDKSYLAVYEGSNGMKRTFLSLHSPNGINVLVREAVDAGEISFDQTGDLIVRFFDDDSEYYEIISPEQERRYNRELTLLRQAGLYRE